MAGRRRTRSGWITIRAKRRGHCDYCGRTFGVGEHIRYDPSIFKVRCPGRCMTIQPQQPHAKPEAPKRHRAYSQWEGEYVYLFDRGDYQFCKCVMCGRSFEGAAGRVAQARKRGVCPACEEENAPEEIERLKDAALASDRARYRASHPPPSS